MALTVRALTDAELADAPALLAPEGWDFEPPELARLSRLGGCLGAFADKRLVAFLSYIDVPPVRWVGNVVVDAAARGAGVGARLVEATFEGASTIGLYSVEKAVTLYTRLGFAPQGEAFTYRAEVATPRSPARASDLEAADLPGVVKLDATATGMDRRALLHELVRGYPRTLRVVRQGGRVTGYGVAKTSSTMTELGPIVAESRLARDALLDELLDAAPGPFEVTALGASEGVLEALDERGFVMRFRTVPMFRGPAPAWQPALLVAAAGLEKG